MSLQERHTRRASGLADRVLYLERGRLRASGAHEQLLESEGGYASMVRAYERRAT